MGKEFQRRAKAMILRAAVLRNQIHVKVWAGTALGLEGWDGYTHLPGLSLVSTAVPSPGREPRGADTGQQPVPDEHQHVRATFTSRMVCTPPPCPRPTLGLPGLSSAPAAPPEVLPVAHLQGSGC